LQGLNKLGERVFPHSLQQKEIAGHSSIRWLASMADESADKEMAQQTDQLMLK
jgi:hypothetical protein